MHSGAAASHRMGALSLAAGSQAACSAVPDAEILGAQHAHYAVDAWDAELLRLCCHLVLQHKGPEAQHSQQLPELCRLSDKPQDHLQLW